jgi:hypothetical protein
MSLRVSVQIETKFGAGLSCHFAVDKLHSVLQSLFQVFLNFDVM